MKKFIVCTVASLGLVSIVMAEGTNVLSDPKSRVSYAVGMMTGHQWKQQEVDFDPDIYARGIKDALSGGVMLLTPEQAQQTIASFKQEFSAKQQTRNAQLAVKNKAAGDAFLAANKNQPGVETLPDGLQYLVLTKGTGATPTPSDTVTVNYRGTLIDGTEFDSSYKRGQPAQFPVGGVIRGWTEALLKMPVGSKWKLFIPSELAYGESGQRSIAPNSVLIFEVELLDTKTPAPPAPPAPAQPLTSDIIKVPSADEMKKGAKIEVIKADDAAKATSGAK
jgi:FKBP-type peptidyl-prolyl cis-trans isomerase FklB